MRKHKKDNKYKDRTYSSKIEGARDRIYKAAGSNIHLAMIFFPRKGATQMRAAFLAIFYEIRNARDKKKRTLNHIPKKYDILQSCFSKARAKMVRIGLINRYDGYWGFSTRFERAMERLISYVHALQNIPETKEEENMEFIYIETAKGQEIHYKLIKKQKKEDKDETHDA